MPAASAAYLSSLPEDRRLAVERLLEVLRQHLPPGFAEMASDEMVSFVVPHERYPAGYHCDPRQPLPFMSVAAGKNHVALDHMGLYQGELREWFVTRWAQVSSRKLDMGKACVRFKQPAEIPYELVAELAGRMTPEQWIAQYEEWRRR